MSGFIPKRVRQGYLGTKRNQTGLKTHGSPAMLGHRFIGNVIRRRVAPLNAPWIPKPPVNQGLAGGVGRINAPRFKCGTCESKKDKCSKIPDMIVSNDIYQYFNGTNDFIEVTLHWPNIECASYYSIYLYGNNGSIEVKHAYDNKIVFDNTNNKYTSFSIHACNDIGCSYADKISLVNCNPLKIYKDNIGLSNNPFIQIKSIINDTIDTNDNKHTIKVLFKWSYNQGFNPTDKLYQPISILYGNGTGTNVELKVNNLDQTYISSRVISFDTSYRFKIKFICSNNTGIHYYNGNFSSPSAPPKPPDPDPHPSCICADVISPNEFSITDYPTNITPNSIFGFKISRLVDSPKYCFNDISGYNISIANSSNVDISNTDISNIYFGDFYIVNKSISKTNSIHEFNFENTKLQELIVSDLSYNTPYIIKIKTKSSKQDLNDCSFSKTISTPSNPSPPPHPPHPPTPSGDSGFDISKCCNLYITMYGNSSITPFNSSKFFDTYDISGFQTKNPYPGNTPMKAWLYLKEWFKEIGNDYANVVGKFINTKYIAWNGTDHGIVYPPTEDRRYYFADKVVSYTTGSSPFLSPNGSIAYDSSAVDYSNNEFIYDIREASQPLIINNFLKPLKKQMERKYGIRDLSYMEIAYDVYPKCVNPFYAWDIGNFGSSKNDQRLTDISNGNPITPTSALSLYTPSGEKPKLKKTLLTTYDISGNTKIGNGTGIFSGRPSYNYLDYKENKIKFQVADGNFGTYNYTGIENLTDASAVNEFNKSYPLDNMHQYFITIYLTNQKIMEYNHNNPTETIPLITGISLDGEGGGDYLREKENNTYPAADPMSGELMTIEDFRLKCPSATEIKCGLGNHVGVGYMNYLYNRYMPKQCLPQWRLEPSGALNEPDINIGGIVPNIYDFSLNYQNPMKLWDTSYPWNIGQQRNYSAEAGVNYKTSNTSDKIFNYANNTYNYHWKKLRQDDTIRPYGTIPEYISNPTGNDNLINMKDGIQRYNIATIKYGGNAFYNYNQGFWHSFIEAYNVGENQPPVDFQPDKNKDPLTKYNKNDLTVNGGRLPGKSQIPTLYTISGEGLPEISSNFIVSNFKDNLGSGCYTGTNIICDARDTYPTTDKDFKVPFCQIDQNKIGDNFKLNCITNSLYIKLWETYKYGQGYSQSDPSGISPAISDIFMRHKDYDKIPPLDGRGFKSLKSLSGEPLDNIKANIITNQTQCTDGCYCPLDWPFVNPSGGDISLNLFYNNNSSTLSTNTYNDGSGGPNQNIGPIGNVLILQFAYLGATLTPDPRTLGPAYNKDQDPNKYPTMPKNALFTKKGQTFQQRVFDKLMCPSGAQAKYKNISLQNSGKLDWPWVQNNWPGNSIATPPLTQKETDPLRILWRDNGTLSGTTNAYGDNTNAFGFINKVNDIHNLMYGLSRIMCGPKNQSRANIGIYSIEFLNANLID
jgi:hypothetical protein